MIKLKIKTFAKINLCLDIVGKREDGYHNLETIMQSIDLYDEIELSKDKEISIDCNHSLVPTDRNNIAYRAAQKILLEAGINDGVKINIKKNIPVAAGLAGGSTNAAGVLIGLNYLYNLNYTIFELINMGKTLGADVPFCIVGGTVLAEGIGDRIKLLPPLKKNYIVLVNPGAEISTKEVYKAVKIEELSNRPNIKKALNAIEKEDIQLLYKSMGNVLQPITEKMLPVVADIRTGMLRLGADAALMCGSGPTVFAICAGSKTANNIYNYYKDVYSNVYLCKTI